MIRPILAAAALSVAALPAFAGMTEPFEMQVNIDRAALETSEGAQQVFATLKQDVHERCTVEAGDWTFASRYAVSFCETRTLQSAVKTIGDANLTAAYEASLTK